jgi:hypothetical protein
MGSVFHSARNDTKRRSARGRSLERVSIADRRAHVWHFVHRLKYTLADTAKELAKRNIVVHLSTISRDYAVMLREHGERYAHAFDPFRELGADFADLEHVRADGMRALASKVLKPSDRAALIRAVTLAIMSKAALQERVGLLPRGVRELIKVPDAPTERIPNAAEIREWIAAARVLDSDLISRAEREGDWGGDAPTVVEAEAVAAPQREPEELPRAVGADEHLIVPVRAVTPARRIGGLTALKFQPVPDRDDGPQF